MNTNDNLQEIEKIIISPEDELVDILKEVEKTRAKRIILTFVESSDLLISPINLKVIQDSADDLNKPLISLIVQNPTGVRNAREAGMTVTESSGSIIDTFWDQAERTMSDRIKEKHETLKRTHTARPTIEEVEIEDRSENDRNEFKKTIDGALEKSKLEIERKNRVIEENGVLLSLDQEFTSKEEPTLLGKNFTKTESEKKSKKNKFVFPKLTLPNNLPSFLLKIVLPIFIFLALATYIAYISMPLVRVKIFVESKGVSIDRVFSGDLKTLAFDSQAGVVPVKKEESNKSASNSTRATGTSYRGTKAEGVIVVKYYDIIGFPAGVVLKAGTIVTSTAGLKYETTAEAQIKNFINDPIPVKAVAVGEEYNLAAGQVFTVAGYTATQMDASNSSPFEGGSKTAFTILSKADVDKVVTELKKNLYKEAESELQEKSDGTWELIPTSLVNAEDGAPVTDVPIGSEAETANITLKTKSTALYYQKNSIDGAIKELLTKAANDKNLFSGSENSLILEENLTKTIEVIEVKKDTIKVAVKASSNIQPEVNKNELIDKLKGKSWNDGKSIISSMKYTDKENEITFSPDFFPDWLKYFPSRQGRIVISLEEIVKE